MVIIIQSLKYETNNEELGPMYYFSACMTSKISQLKFGAHKFERAQWSRIKPFEKNSWSIGPPISPIRSSGAPFSPSLGSLICPLRHQRAPKCSITPSRAQFPVFPSGNLAPQFPYCFIKGFQSPLRHQMAPNFPLRQQGPKISSSCHQNDDL